MRQSDPRDEERQRELKRFQELLDTPMIVLGIIWLALLIVELAGEAGPGVVAAGAVIWVIFVIEFVVEIFLAPDRAVYLRANVLTFVSLLAPAFRLLRVLRVVRGAHLVRLTRSLRLVTVVGSANRSMSILGEVMGRRKLGYVIALTAIITVSGAAGIHALEKENPGFSTFGSSLWWSAMIMTTMGSQFWPQSPEGRILCVLLALYAFTVFGYVTASLATFFIDLDSGIARPYRKSPPEEKGSGEK